MNTNIMSLVGLSFTCQPANRPLQTITVKSISIGEAPANSNKTTGLVATCEIVTLTKAGPVSQTCQMGLVTVFERLEYQVAHEPIVVVK